MDELDDGVNLDMYDDEYESNSVMLDTNYNQDYYNPPKKYNQLSPSRVELLSKLLEQEEREQENNDTNTPTETNNSNNFFVDIFKSLSKKFTNKPVSEQNITKNKKYEYDDPDTPPSSPINSVTTNKLNSNILFDVFESAKLKCRSTFVESLSTYFQPANAPTPPGTPCNELDEDYLNETQEIIETNQLNFFDQIVNKLNIFSFKSVSNVTQKDENNNNKKTLIVKPLPIYANKQSSPLTTDDNVFKLEEDIVIEDDFEQDNNVEEEEIKIEMNRNMKNCETPPSSPSKFSPPLHYDDDNFDSTQLNKTTSAFARVASINPLINKSIDLASLLGSLSSLKRNQRLCKYY